MAYEIPQGRINPQAKSTFGKVKKPFKGKNKNRKGKILGSTISDKKIKPTPVKIPSYLSWFHEVHQPPCFVCGSSLGIEAHHVKKNSVDFRNDKFILPLCWEHHHGYDLSPHGSPAKFRDVYPMDIQIEFSTKMHEAYLAQKP